jgi:hypothetical protein
MRSRSFAVAIRIALKPGARNARSKAGLDTRFHYSKGQAWRIKIDGLITSQVEAQPYNFTRLIAASF